MENPGAPEAEAGREALLASLRDDSLDAFEQVGAVLDAALALGVAYAADAQRVRRDLGGHARTVRDLHLVMPIVAPMKAGKSTLVNALVGYPLLPARANPMTTLPTRIRLVDGLDPEWPEMTVPPDTVAFFDRVVESVRTEVGRSGWRPAEEHSQLVPLLQEITAGTVPPVLVEYRGRAEIHAVLTRLNDLLRLAVLANAGDVISELHELPELRSGFWSGSAVAGATGGELVLVDTPGPNEYALSSQLGAVLDAVLRASHVVLVVLDFTQMGSSAAEQIRELLGPQLAVIGREKILAVVNKVDLRGYGGNADQGPAQTRAAVAAGLGLTAEQAAAQVFESVATWGLSGSRVLIEADRDGDAFAPGDSEAVRALMRERAPFSAWEEIRPALTAPQVRRDALQVVERSGVTALAQQALGRLRAGAVPVLLGSGLRRHLDAVDRLDPVVRLEVGATGTGGAEIAAALADLDRDLQRLEAVRAALPDPAALVRAFRRDLEKFVGEVRDQGRDVVALLEASPGSAVPPPRRQRFPGVLAVLDRGRRILANGVLAEQGDADLKEFDSPAAADAYAARMSATVADQLGEVLGLARTELGRRVDGLAARAIEVQEREVRALLASSTAKLSQTFAVQLDVPKPVVSEGAITVELPKATVRSETRYSSGWDSEEEVPLVSWFFPKTFTKRVVVHHSGSSYDVHHHQVSRKAVAAALRTAFDSQLDTLRGELADYVAKEVRASLDAYFGHVGDFLVSLRDTVQRAVDSSRLSAHEKQRRLDALTALLARTHEQQLRLGSLLTRLAEYEQRGVGA
ncbi:dynamin family protein [Kitasatospora sp. NPDC058965]|uniref:dynamin family protein n=1 Tax=Kitasatospora sp. NPDC058965 TaxID=3346682 RepID=UPI0036AE5D66